MTTPPSPPASLDLDNIQGDILSGFPKKTETYYFFQITDVARFKADLLHLVPVLKTVKAVLHDRKRIEDHKKNGGYGLIHMDGVNIAFSHLGFEKLGVDDSTLSSDDADPFRVGQVQEAVATLGDVGRTTPDGTTVPDWDPAFLKPLHGLILVSGDKHATVDKKLREVEAIFHVHTPRASISEVTRIRGDVRPGAEDGHEHFGFMDGISNPKIVGFNEDTNPGPDPVQPGVIVTGHEDDPLANIRAPWAVDGSFLVFRYLVQQVPEFNEYLKQNPITFEGLTPEEGSELLGARMVGRWKSGAPIDITPFKDDLVLADDPKRNNDFRFEGELNSQFKCPFAAHVRKTNPRDDLEKLPPPIGPISVQPRRIIRRGIQFGPELTQHEKETGKTEKERGLLFVCYQSSIRTGFQFIQQSWANNATFPIGETRPEVPGLDPLIGQGSTRQMSGLDPNDETKELSFPDFIIARGGEYFFSPSIKALKETLGAEA